MSKIKIGAQVTAKVRPTKVTVSGTFQGYELEDPEDPTSGCGKVLYVKDGMMYLDRVYIDSIKVCENKNETMRKRIINILTNNTDAHEEGAALYAEEIAWLKAAHENDFVSKPAEWSEEDKKILESIIARYEFNVKSDFAAFITKDALEDFKKELEWLKSLRPQPHWKPSEKMLKALNWAKCEFHPDCPETMEQLKYLYAELKKIYHDGN